jgi:hypothetical protein
MPANAQLFLPKAGGWARKSFASTHSAVVTDSGPVGQQYGVQEALLC